MSLLDRAALRLVPTCDRAGWDALVHAAPGGSAYHAWDWLDLQQDLLGVGVARRLVDVGGDAVGVFPVVRSGPRGMLSRGMPFPFLGPLVPAEHLVPAVQAMRRLQRVAPILRLRFELPPAAALPGVAAALATTGAIVHEDSTVVVDLQHRSVDALRAGYIKPRRRNLRHAEAAGVVVRPSVDGEFAGLIGPLLAESYGARGHACPYPSTLGPRFEAWSRGRDDVRSFTALVGGEPAGVLAMLGGFPTAIAWVGGALRRHRAVFASVALHDALLVAALEAGHDRVDLSGWVDDAVGRYKLGFGGQRLPYVYADSVLVPRQAYIAARSVRQRVRRRTAA